MRVLRNDRTSRGPRVAHAPMRLRLRRARSPPTLPIPKFAAFEFAAAGHDAGAAAAADPRAHRLAAARP